MQPSTGPRYTSRGVSGLMVRASTCRSYVWHSGYYVAPRAMHHTTVEKLVSNSDQACDSSNWDIDGFLFVGGRNSVDSFDHL